MRVKIFENLGDTLVGECDLMKCFPVDWNGNIYPEYYRALRELQQVGRYWIDRHGEPLALLMPVR